MVRYSCGAMKHRDGSLTGTEELPINPQVEEPIPLRDAENCPQWDAWLVSARELNLSTGYYALLWVVIPALQFVFF